MCLQHSGKITFNDAVNIQRKFVSNRINIRQHRGSAPIQSGGEYAADSLNSINSFDSCKHTSLSISI